MIFNKRIRRVPMRKSALIVALALSACGLADELSPFTSDGCSSFPDGTLAAKNLWLACCTAHDLAYWQGGSYQQRLTADRELQQCVARTGEDEIARLMLAGVRVGGTPYLPTRFRWGYGWPYLRGYQPLTTAKKILIAQQLEITGHKEPTHSSDNPATVDTPANSDENN